MSKPEALRLAEIMEATDQMCANADLSSKEVADELRRLHKACHDLQRICQERFEELQDLYGVNTELLQSLEEVVDWLELGDHESAMHTNARLAIAKATGEQNDF